MKIKRKRKDGYSVRLTWKEIDYLRDLTGLSPADDGFWHVYKALGLMASGEVEDEEEFVNSE